MVKTIRPIAVGLALAMVIAACSAESGDDSLATEGSEASSTADAGEAPGDAATSETSTPTEPPGETVEFDIDSTPNPASVEISLDDGTSASATIGAAGGTINATGAGGMIYTLTIPAGALFTTTEITMTPIATVSGDAVGDTFLAGVDLQPTGLQLLDVAMLEISAPGLDDSVGWGSESGEDFHLAPSDHTDGTSVIPVLHFSELGLAERQLEQLLESQGIIPEDLDARLQQALVSASDETAMKLATAIAEVLTLNGLAPGDPAGDYAFFEEYSHDVLTHLFRVSVISDQRGWGPETPGFEDLRAAYFDLAFSWFATGDGIVAQQTSLCEDGHIEGAFRILRQGLIGAYAVGALSLLGGPDAAAEDQGALLESYMQPWAETGVDCLLFGMTWQARIITTGAGFSSDISIGSEALPELSEEYDALEALLSWGGPGTAQDVSVELPSVPVVTDLEIEWFEGFFADPIIGCEPANGMVEMEYYDFDVYIPNVGNFGDVIVESTPFWVRVKVVEPISLVCEPAFNIGGDAAYPFHLGALEHLNGQFSVSGYWDFAMIYEPGDGEVARFEQGFPVEGQGVIVDAPNLAFGDGTYELWQLVTVYQG